MTARISLILGKTRGHRPRPQKMEFKQIINPARFSEVVGQVPMYSTADVDRVLSQAQTAFKTWSHTTPDERASALRAAAGKLRNALPELVPLFVRENGKPI